MRASFVSAGVAIVQLANAERVKFGVLSDIHLQPFYRPDKPVDGNYFCVDQDFGDETTSDMAYFGRLGCDLPALMVERAFQKMSTENPDINFILVPGDFVGHELTLDPDDTSMSEKDK